MRRIYGLLTPVLLCLALVLPTLVSAQIIPNGDDARIWTFISQREEANREFLMVMAIPFDSYEDGVAKIDEAVSTGFLDEFVSKPEYEPNHSLNLWCYQFVGGPELYDSKLEGAWAYTCQVEFMAYIIVFYGNDLQPAIEVIEDLIVYDSPTVPDGWIDITDDIDVS